MGFIRKNLVRAYVSKAGRLCVVAKFKNKNEELDDMYIEISNDTLEKLNDYKTENLSTDEFGPYEK